MTDPAETIDAEDVQSRLPDGWTVENDGKQAVHGYAVGPEEGEFPDPAEVPASFGIRRKNDLWTAVWLEPNEVRGGRHELADHATGIKDRCIEWIAEKATGLKEGVRE